MIDATVTRSELQTLLTNTTVIRNLQSKYASDSSRFHNDHISEACDSLLGLTPSLHTRIFMYYNLDGEALKQTFNASEIGEVIINDPEISDSIKKEIMYISALQIGVELDELYPEPISRLEGLIVACGKELKHAILSILFQECQAVLWQSLSV